MLCNPRYSIYAAGPIPNGSVFRILLLFIIDYLQSVDVKTLISEGVHHLQYQMYQEYKVHVVSIMTPSRQEKCTCRGCINITHIIAFVSSASNKTISRLVGIID